MSFWLARARRFRDSVHPRCFSLTSTRRFQDPVGHPGRQKASPTNFNAIQKFLSINTSLTQVDFGSKSISMRLLSPSSDVMNFTERDVFESPLRSNLPFWAFLWPGGYAVTRWILEGSCSLEGSVVVDIGSGCASASIGAKMQGAAAVLANDTDPLACIAAADNSRCNGVAGVTPCALDLLPLQPSPRDAAFAVTALEQRIARCAPHVSEKAPRMLLLGDMLYDGEVGPRVMALSEAACARGWRVITGDPGRSIAASQGPRLGKCVACYDLSAELRANNHGMASTSVYIAGGG